MTAEDLLNEILNTGKGSEKMEGLAALDDDDDMEKLQAQLQSIMATKKEFEDKYKINEYIAQASKPVNRESK